jgi:DNA-directed RNA polymerase subunit beta'
MIMEMFNEEFDFIKISLASPESIRKSIERILPDGKIIGEVKKTDTINYRTFKPEIKGLFCERIFGPLKTGECNCGLYKNATKLGFMCEICGVEITDSRVRRHRMGYIKLLSSVSHVWYLKSRPNYIASILREKVKDLDQVVYLSGELKKDNRVKNEDFLVEGFLKTNNKNHGAELIEKKLLSLNLKKEIMNGRFELYKILDLKKREKEKKRIRILETFLSTNSNPSWMILSILPVIPPGLRPMIQLEGGRFATSDLNELYRRIIMRNNRLGKLFEIHAPDIVIRNEKRLLQEAVDALIDNGKRGEKVVDINNRPFKSLADAIEGKQGRFRQNLLGKRVDYSGRSVIAVDPKLKLNQCGLPYEMAIELYQPFLIFELIQKGIVSSIRTGRKIINENRELVSHLLKKIFKTHPIILNRAPTLHRLGVQAFEPILVNYRAIFLHPLVCSPFNADFDGDQMAVHIPLSIKAQAEAISLLFAPSNFLSPATGLPMLIPSQDMLLGCYYLTANNLFGLKNSSHYFSNTKDAILAWENKQIDLHSLIWVRYNGYVEDEDEKIKQTIKLNENLTLLIYETRQIKINNTTNKILVTYLKTTIGRLIFNNFIEKSLNLPL